MEARFPRQASACPVAELKSPSGWFSGSSLVVTGSLGRRVRTHRLGLLLIGTSGSSVSWCGQPGEESPLLVRPGALSPVQGLRPTPGRPRKRRSASSPTCPGFYPATLREVQKNSTTKLSLVTILASCLLATMAIGSAQAAMRHHQAASACAAQPGTLRAFFCPAPAAPAKPLHHRHAKA